MASATLAAPGAKYGPCEEPCEHIDCAKTREMAGKICGLCDEAIGYGRSFYKRDAPAHQTFDRDELVHASCYEDAWRKEMAGREE